ncbi:ABC transporter ATP-binding protein [Legionella jordanis]|uniref:ABC-type dipeptide transporter n=1 Tax=Legionella jordanis TaxID=456 RepID=A0A0W0VDA3_9GAMM|nr:ABC transporter ATP-binding protein [Legionella jordanis]KTD17853.1 ABC dipeptide/oligopeptide/nickel transport, ATPase component [Legionella jordanis]RMX02448.1 ABC transporter ATP-binding protein [Legionella jordanis]RMX21709.1 ABC transporter ATP-binding protein [Legionella jordanis]VEH11210.1 ABC dipeptide/oligopeptide/nickel transport, ATPase component [Legionella jordanis]HAT8713822.1 dipeptide ABC transporter ATP-binding protein [Legionella jordanis]
MSELVNINDLTVAFQSKEKTQIAVDAVNFSLQQGETLALLGESGCGKSITSLALMRLLPLHGVYGKNSRVMVQGNDVLALPEYWMRNLRGKKLAMVFQEPMTALNPVLTIGQQLAEVLKRQGVERRFIKEQILSLLKEVEIPMPHLRLRQYPHQLSGGQKQRIVIAMAIASKPEILIADEPTTALDVTIQAQILTLLKKLQQQYHMSILLITHDLSVVKAMADRVCVLYAGQVVEQASVADFFKQVRHPYSQQLLASLPSFNKRHQRLESIPGAVPALGNWPKGCRFHPRCAHAFSICPNIEPQLQEISTTTVRCHLYPTLDSPPPLSVEKQDWQSSEEDAEILLSVKNLCVHFRSGTWPFKQETDVIKAVDGLTFDLAKGKTLALVGESGCGKTTASRAILRLLPITRGEVLYRGKLVGTLKNKALRDYRKQVQIIFQDPFSSMNPRMTIAEILAEGMHAQHLPSALVQKKQELLLDQVNLPRTSLQRYPHQFSGGQRQRICIARALAIEPELLICDEPTSALDVSVQAQILNLLKELQQETGLSYLFITHNMAVVSYIADHVLVMNQGRVVESGSCEQILKHPKKAYTQQLLASVLQI